LHQTSNILLKPNPHAPISIGSVFDKGYRYGFNIQEKDEEIAKGHYIAPYWEYDSRLGRRWNLDPIVKFYLSSYSVLHNNPILFIDIKGDDDFFDCEGKYLGSTVEGNLIRVIHTGVTFENAKLNIDINTKLISNFKFSRSIIGIENRNMLTKITGYYALPLGILKYGAEESKNQSSAAFYDKKNGTINIAISSLGDIKDVLDDKNNFINTIVHEKEHRDYEITHNNLFHPRAIITQIKDPSWKNTTSDFKYSLIEYAVDLYNDAANEKNKDGTFKYTKEKILDEINDFNNTLKESGSDVHLQYDSETRNIKSVNNILELKGTKTKSKKTEKKDE